MAAPGVALPEWDDGPEMVYPRELLRIDGVLRSSPRALGDAPHLGRWHHAYRWKWMAHRASSSGRRKARIETTERGRSDGRSGLRVFLVIGGAAILVAGIVMARRRSRSAPPRRPGRFEESVQIARPPDEVFAFVADPRNDARWTPQIEEMRKTSEGSLGVGSTFEVVVNLLGRRFEISGERSPSTTNRTAR